MEFKKFEDMFYLGEVEDPKAYISWSVQDGVLNIEHTVVKPELGGQGVAAKLTDRLVEYCKEEGYKVKPICSYAVKYFEKHEELEDMLA